MSLSWSNPLKQKPHKRSNRSLVYQLLVVASLLLFFALIVTNTLTNMHQRGIQGGFDFLGDPAGFEISESWITFDSADSYAKAFGVGLVNTLRVSVLSIVLSTIIGTLLGLGRLSANPLLRFLCQVYTEVFRNIPLLIQLLIWYVVFVEYLPEPESPLTFGGSNFEFFLSKEGFTLPWFSPSTGVLFQSASMTDGNLTGGATLTPEFVALFTGLSLYTGAFIAEVVRAGLLSVSKAQIQAGLSLGLRSFQITRLIVVPQALRVIIPPMANQYLNLIKNSSLAVAIGYPDLVNISNTTLNQTGHAVECVLVIMLIYLSLSLFTSGLMNAYNRRVISRG